MLPGDKQTINLEKLKGKVVYLDFWASWCKNCLVMERTTFRDPAVRDRLEGFVRLKVRAEAPAIGGAPRGVAGDAFAALASLNVPAPKAERAVAAAIESLGVDASVEDLVRAALKLV